MKNLDSLFQEHSDAEGGRFAKLLSEFIVDKGIKIIVETGSGISSLFILKAIEGTHSKLYSIDPSPWCNFQVDGGDNYEHINKRSVDAMDKLFIKTGEWGLFLHDGNHDILCQTYEYEFAYRCLKMGGYLASDDINWGNNRAWSNFIYKYKLTPFKIGAIDVVQKTHEIYLNKHDAKRVSSEILSEAKDIETKWLAAGNKNTGIFIY